VSKRRIDDMPRPRRSPPCLARGVLFVMLLPLSAEAGQLPIGRRIRATTSHGTPAEFEMRADGAGMLSVLVRGEADLYIALLDRGNVLRRIDRDDRGDAGAEQVAFVIPRAGRYTVRVGCWEVRESEFLIAASWLAVSELEVPEDPDGYAEQATELTLGQEVNDSLDPNDFDEHDWFKVTARGQRLQIEVRATGDVKLEAFPEGNYDVALASADDDIGGDLGHERLALPTEAGATYYVRVSPVGEAAGTYRIVAR
jgi:hypothetical protein